MYLVTSVRLSRCPCPSAELSPSGSGLTADCLLMVGYRQIYQYTVFRKQQWRIQGDASRIGCMPPLVGAPRGGGGGALPLKRCIPRYLVKFSNFHPCRLGGGTLSHNHPPRLRAKFPDHLCACTPLTSVLDLPLSSFSYSLIILQLFYYFGPNQRMGVI